MKFKKAYMHLYNIYLYNLHLQNKNKLIIIGSIWTNNWLYS